VGGCVWTALELPPTRRETSCFGGPLEKYRFLSPLAVSLSERLRPNPHPIFNITVVSQIVGSSQRREPRRPRTRRLFSPLPHPFPSTAHYG
jgi:hypothetical protein